MIDLEERYIEKKSFFNRLIIVYVFFGIVFSFFLYKAYSLQVFEYGEYENAALENKTKEVLVQPVRGIIYDRNGTIIVNNIPTYDLIIKPWLISDLEAFLNELQMIIEIDDSNFCLLYTSDAADE